MSSKLDRLLFIQGHCCFFCKEPLPREAASVEHLIATSRGGTDEVDNCVACCKTLNSLFGDMTVKEKMAVVLQQRGVFHCPKPQSKTIAILSQRPMHPLNDDLVDAAITYLKKYGARRPRSLPELLDILSARFAKQIDAAHAQVLIANLRLLGIVQVDHDGIVSYPTVQRTA